MLLALHKIWPDAPLYTAVYDPEKAEWAKVFRVHPSFLQSMPFAKTNHEFYPWLTPMAFSSFSFDGFDAVISVTSAEAKNIMTKPGTTHISYMLTPTRYLWSGEKDYRSQGILGYGLRMMGSTLKRWDVYASTRPDYYIAISERVKERIETYYHQKVAQVVYPPVDEKWFAASREKTEGYFLTVSRLVGYKRVDVLIRAFNRLKLPLVVVGQGWEKQNLNALAGETITFVDRHLTDEELLRYYARCRAFVYAADEDFGLAAAEAQAAGVPVVAYRQSGVSEIVKNGETGILFDAQTPKAVTDAVTAFSHKRFLPEACRAQAKRMSEQSFSDTMKHVVTKLVRKERS